MNRLFNRKSIAFVLVALALLAGVFGAVAIRDASHAAGTSAHTNGARIRSTSAQGQSSVCAKLGHTMQASSGAQMYCFGPQLNGNSASGGQHSTNHFGSNVDAGNPHEDIAPNGTQSYGQSETSTAAIGSYVVEAWNDATGFFASPCSPMFKDQLTGFGFSSNGGKSFTDEGGLPNINCASSSYSGDASVEAWQPNGTTYFYISSLISVSTTSSLDVAMDACKATSAGLSCGSTPIFLAGGGSGSTFFDKDFLSIDPKRGLLYASYTDFTTGDNIDVTVCDIGGPTGAGGPLGGTAAAPKCSAPLVVASSTGCNEIEGAYPAADIASGDVYVAYESNWATNQFGCALPVQEVVNKVPAACFAALPTFPGPGCPAANAFPQAAINIVSMDSAFIPGYNRFPMNDFPRIAVSDPFGTVSIVWNDARSHLAGDILLQSFKLGSAFPTTVQSAPVRINSSVGGWHMLPALRNTDDNGNLQISFYGRASANTAITNVYAAIDVAPTTHATPNNVLVTTAPSDWNSVSSDIVPNFGDYTDNYVIATSTAPYTQQKLYVAWSDGRLGDPQPFNAHTNTN